MLSNLWKWHRFELIDMENLAKTAVCMYVILILKKSKAYLCVSTYKKAWKDTHQIVNSIYCSVE